jgi:hypothetical protein
MLNAMHSRMRLPMSSFPDQASCLSTTEKSRFRTSDERPGAEDDFLSLSGRRAMSQSSINKLLMLQSPYLHFTDGRLTQDQLKSAPSLWARTSPWIFFAMPDGAPQSWTCGFRVKPPSIPG